MEQTMNHLAGLIERRRSFFACMLDYTSGNFADTYIILDAALISHPVLRRYISAANEIKLSVSPRSIVGSHLNAAEDSFDFGATFSGNHIDLAIPMDAIKTIYGQGVVNDPNEIDSFTLAPWYVPIRAHREYLTQQGVLASEPVPNPKGADKGMSTTASSQAPTSVAKTPTVNPLREAEAKRRRAAFRVIK